MDTTWPNGYACDKGTPGCGTAGVLHVACDVSSEMARRHAAHQLGFLTPTAEIEHSEPSRGGTE